MTHPTIILGPAAPRIRRRLGPVPWAVLEALHGVAVDVNGGTIAAANTRDLSEGLGIGRDTVARALRVLREEGLVSFDAPRSEGGRFERASYRLHTPRDAIRSRSERTPATATRVVSSRVEKRAVASVREQSPSTSSAQSISPRLNDASTSAQLAFFSGGSDADR